MKDVNELFAECMQELESIGIIPLPIVEVTVNKRAKKRFGQASVVQRSMDRERKPVAFRIEVAEILLQDCLPDYPAKNTIIHEILHCCEGCFNHGNNWKVKAETVNRKLGYNIQRCSNYSKYGLYGTPLAKKNGQPKYEVYCPKCGTVWKYYKEGRVVSSARRGDAKCGVCHVPVKLRTLR